MKKGIITLLIITLMISIIGCTSNQGNETEKRTITVGTSADFPPFESVEIIDGKDKIIGFDIDLMNEIAKELDANIVFENMDFNGLVAAVQTGKIDMAISGMSVNDERKEKVNFSDSYYEASQTLVVKSDSKEIATMDEMKGKLVGSQLGSTSDDAISTFKDVEVKKYNKVPDAIQDLKNGRIDAVIVEDSIASVFVQKNKELKIVVPEGLNTESTPFAIAMPKEKADLLKEVNAALQKIKDSGKYDELITKWFE